MDNGQLLISADFWPLFSLNSFGISNWKGAFQSDLLMEVIFGRNKSECNAMKVFFLHSFKIGYLKALWEYYEKYNLSNFDHKYNFNIALKVNMLPTELRTTPRFLKSQCNEKNAYLHNIWHPEFFLNHNGLTFSWFFIKMCW